MKSNGGSSSYYDLPRGPNGEWPKTLQQVIKWYDNGNGNGKGMEWNQANIFKAAYRWAKKPSKEYNARKTVFFGQDTLDDIYERERPSRD